MSGSHKLSISVQYDGVQVLGPLSLELAHGEVVVVIGKSGCGKSTLLNSVYDELREHSALIPQELGLVESLSVYHNVYMGRLDRLPRWYNVLNLLRPFAGRVAEITPLLENMQLEEKLWQRVEALSGGQKQRVAIARVLYQQASLLLADEPVSALDGPKSDHVMASLIQHYPTALIALHDIELALKYGQRIIGISDSEIALDQPAAKLSPQTLLDFY